MENKDNKVITAWGWSIECLALGLSKHTKEEKNIML